MVDDVLWINAPKHLCSLPTQQGAHKTHSPSVSPGADQQPQVIESALLIKAMFLTADFLLVKETFYLQGSP